jgi:hypothetical protein
VEPESWTELTVDARDDHDQLVQAYEMNGPEREHKGHPVPRVFRQGLSKSRPFILHRSSRFQHELIINYKGEAGVTRQVLNPENDNFAPSC